MVTESEEIYFVDPGYFKCFSSLDIKMIQYKNNYFIRNMILMCLSKLLNHSTYGLEIEEYLLQFPKTKKDFIFELMEVMKNYSNLKEYKKDVFDEMKYSKGY